MKSRISKSLILLVIVIGALTIIKARTNYSLPEQEVEPALEIENWMIDESFWNRELKYIPLATEKELVIEEWMYDNDYWS